MRHPHPALLLPILLTPAAAVAQLQWTQIQDWQPQAASPAPPYRIRAAMVATDTEVVLFGGDTQNGPPRNPVQAANDTWIWNPVLGTWTDVTAAGPQPPARIAPAMAYDRLRQRVVCFGGMAATELGDTWERGAQWQQVNLAASPPARWGHVMTYDEAAARVILFGGRSGSSDLGDTWTYNGTTWAMLQPAQSPSPRRAATLTYDAVRQRSVLFGGVGAGGVLNDTWDYQNGIWTQANPAHSPPARSQHAAAYDTYQRRTIVFGGTGSAIPPQDLADIWAFDGTDWVQVPASGTPAAMSKHVMAFACYRPALIPPVNYGILLFGDGQTWSFSAPPPPRQGHAMQDFVGAPPLPSDDLLVVAGMDSTMLADAWHFGAQHPAERDCWEFDPNLVMSPKAWAAMVHRDEVPFVNGHQGYDYLFGGVQPNGTNLASPRTHSYSWFNWEPAHPPRSSSWTLVSSTGPSPRQKLGLVFDAARQVFVMFGGQAGASVLGDTWECSPGPGPVGGIGPWHQVTTATTPSARWGHQLVYDPDRQRVVLFGGSYGGTRFGDTWEYDSAGWQLLTVPAHPSARAEHSLAWNRGRHTVVLFGGEDASGNRNDLWDWTGMLWVQRPVSGAQPSPRRSACLVPWRNGLALFGGFDTQARNDLWLLSTDQPGRATVNTSIGCGTPAPPSIAVAPNLQAPYRLPVLGQELRMRIGGIATTTPVAFLACSLDAGGPVLLPGLEYCGLKPSIAGSWLLGASQGEAFATLSFPSSPALTGLPVWFQGVVPQPGVNVLGLAFSGWLEGLLGRW